MILQQVISCRKINIQYDNKLRIVSVEDIYGGTYNYAYEDKGLVSTVTYTSANAEHTRTIYYEHDRYNNLTRIEAADENGNSVVKRISYTYDENGYLSSKLIETKQVDGSFTQSERYDYTWAYGKLINQLHTKYETTQEPQQTVIKFVYDSYNSVQGFIVNDTASYIYLKNLQGDILGVVDESGDEVASYSYDVWGKQTGTFTEDVVKLLPLAYRGYFLDNDTGLYFIDKRAYNPNWGKFLDSASAEAEGMPEIDEYNMYTYWENNPVWYMTEEEKEAYKVNSIANYLHNQGITQGILESADVPQEELFIYNQNTRDINKYRCGVVTSGPKGCGWIATYNASKLLGYNLKPEEIIKEYEEMGIFMQGFFGVHPFAVAKFFTDRGHDINVHFGDFVDLDTLNNLSEVNIMFYDGKPTGHYAAIQYKDNEFVGYNVFGSTKVEPMGNSISNPIKRTNTEGDVEDNTESSAESASESGYVGKVLISISPKEQTIVVS